jgi:hypothetical protein
VQREQPAVADGEGEPLRLVDTGRAMQREHLPELVAGGAQRGDRGCSAERAH